VQWDVRLEGDGIGFGYLHRGGGFVFLVVETVGSARRLFSVT
jgi:hypothetical protein